MKCALNKISAYLNPEEHRTFKLRVKASGLTESMYIREMLSFDVTPRGAPKGPRKKKQINKSASPAKPNRPSKKRQETKPAQGKTQLSLLD